MIGQKLPSRISHNPIPKNTPKALTIALIGFIIFFTISLFSTGLFQGTALIGSDFTPTISSILREGFAITLLSEKEPIFARSIFWTIIAFAVVIATIETWFIGRLMEFLAVKTKTPLDISFRNWNMRLLAIITIISGIFAWLHANAKGPEDNVAWIMTFLFSFISLIMIARTKELEPAVYLHIINNFVFIAARVGLLTFLGLSI